MTSRKSKPKLLDSDARLPPEIDEERAEEQLRKDEEAFAWVLFELARHFRGQARGIPSPLDDGAVTGKALRVFGASVLARTGRSLKGTERDVWAAFHVTRFVAHSLVYALPGSSTVLASLVQLIADGAGQQARRRAVIECIEQARGNIAHSVSQLPAVLAACAMEPAFYSLRASTVRLAFHRSESSEQIAGTLSFAVGAFGDRRSALAAARAFYKARSVTGASHPRARAKRPHGKKQLRVVTSKVTTKRR